MSAQPAPENPAAIELDALARSFGSVEAVKPATLTVARGEFVGLLGHNGAGKSTIIRMLTCRLRPTSGTARVLGADVVSEQGRIRPRINMVFDRQNLHPGMTGVETLRYWGRLYGADEQLADSLLERVGLDPKRSSKVRDYSTGMRQRLIVARALLNDPEVLFLDEPTRGLDPASARDLRTMLTELHASGTTVFLTTHDMHEADALCERVAFIAHGSIVGCDSPTNLRMSIGHERRVQLTLRDGSTEELALDPDAERSRLSDLLERDDVMTMHTLEPTLADVFIELAGRPLDDTRGEAAEQEGDAA